MKQDNSEQDWKKNLTPEEYEVLRNKGTEPPFSGIYESDKEPGLYQCKACGNDLFRSEDKFDSGSGWPSFQKPIEGAVEEHEDSSLGMKRTEITCAKCQSHLGHVFNDGPDKMPDGSTCTGLRYCINSVALNKKET